MPSGIKKSKTLRTHVVLAEEHQEQMKILKREIGSASAVIRNALDEYLPSKIEEINQRIESRKSQTLQALQLQKQRASIDTLEDAYATRSDDFKSC